MTDYFSLAEALFTYAVADGEMSIFPRQLPMKTLPWIVNLSSRTDALTACDGSGEVWIIGLCVDSRGEYERSELPSLLLAQAFSDAEKAYRFCDRFAGKYVILLHTKEFTAVWGDATASLPIHYGMENGKFCFSSFDAITAAYFGKTPSPRSERIRFGSDLQQPLPNDITMYDGIRILLANHWLDAETGQVKRILIDVHTVSEEGIDRVIRYSMDTVSHIASEYSKHYDLVCPLTSGYDSRIVYAFLKKNDPALRCYTFFHRGFTDETADVCIPRQICADQGMTHTFLPDVSAPDSFAEELSSFAGPWFDRRTLDLAFTFRSSFEGKALLTGDIVDHIAKSSLGYLTPPWASTASFFTCKIHNHEKEALREMRRYVRDIRQSGQKKYILDLFSLESRCGRWASLNCYLYALCGVAALNLFNCRSLILAWMSVPTGERVRHRIHNDLFRLLDDELLRYPFNPGSNGEIWERHWVPFYLATYLKQLIGLVTYKRKKRKFS